MAVDVIIEDARWREVAFAALAERATDAVLVHFELSPDEWDIACLACDDARIAALNADFRGKPVPTNVLSWPSAERGAPDDGGTPEPPEEGELGDIAIAFETCAAEAQAAGRPMEHHILHLIVHAALHLLGYDHARDLDGDLMERTETEILAKLAVPDPYASDRHDRPD